MEDHRIGRQRIIIVTPYIRFDGIPTFKDSDIIGLYDKMVSDGFANVIFCDGSVRCGRDFLAQMNESGTVLLVAFHGNQVVGLGWLNCFEHRTARAHFYVFDEGRNMGAVFVGNELIDKSFSLNNLEMLIGMVPEFNQPAIKFAQKCGAILVGTMPKGSYNINTDEYIGTAILYYLRRK